MKAQDKIYVDDLAVVNDCSTKISKKPLPNFSEYIRKDALMDEAVEADVNIYRDLAAGKSWAEFVVEMPTSDLCDKARIIILPKGAEQ